MDHLAIVAADGDAAAARGRASEALDRGISQPRWATMARTSTRLWRDDMFAWRAHPDRRGRGADHRKTIVLDCVTARASAVVIRATTAIPTRSFRRRCRRQAEVPPLTHQNDAVRAAAARDDGGGPREEARHRVHGLLAKPAGYQPGTKSMLLRSTAGRTPRPAHVRVRASVVRGRCAVLAVNYRGSAGCAAAFERSGPTGATTRSTICTRWSTSREMGVHPGQARRRRLSYGDLTDYLIASDTASSGDQRNRHWLHCAFYGTDQYHQHDNEIWPAIRKAETYARCRIPHADRITRRRFSAAARLQRAGAGGQQMPRRCAASTSTRSW